MPRGTLDEIAEVIQAASPSYDAALASDDFAPGRSGRWEGETYVPPRRGRRASFDDIDPLYLKPSAATLASPAAFDASHQQAADRFSEVLNYMKPATEAAVKPGLGFARPGIGGEITQPWTDLAKRGVHGLAAPFANTPGVSWIRDALESAIQTTGDVAGGALDFGTSPAGLATVPLGGSANPLVRGAVQSAVAGLMVPGAVEGAAEALRKPTPENVGRAVVKAAAAALPVAGAAGAEARYRAGGIERHNTEAARLVQQEAKQPSYDTAQGEAALGQKSVKVRIGDKTVDIQPAGASDTGRPYYNVVDSENGKVVYGGYGPAVQGYLRQQGAAPLSERTARYTESQPTGPTPERNFPPKARTSAEKPTIPEEGPPENVVRVQAAREKLAQDMAGKSFKDLNNPDRLVIDHFVTQGYGFAELTPEATQTLTPKPAKQESETKPKETETTVVPRETAKPGRATFDEIAATPEPEVRDATQPPREGRMEAGAPEVPAVRQDVRGRVPGGVNEPGVPALPGMDSSARGAPHEPRQAVEDQPIALTKPAIEAPPPVVPAGAVKPSKLAHGVEEKAIANKLTEGFEGKTEYATVNVAQQARAAADLLRIDRQRAINVAMGHEPPPEGLLPESMFVAVENHATETKNVALLRDLATSSSLTGEASGMGQRIRMLAERNPNSAVAAIQEVARTRESAAVRRFGPKAKETIRIEIKADMNKAAPKPKDWASFIESIKC